MKLEEDKLKIDRELSKLDRKVLDFTQKLHDLEINYAIISGYVAILTGRSRGTEDIDMLIERLNCQKIEKIVEEITEAGYWCINPGDREIYQMLKEGLAVRFAEKEKVIPNFELKFPTDKFDRRSLEESIKASLGSKEIKISPIELQIAYKLYLGSEKDIEDALHLYQLFKEDLDKTKLEQLAKEMEVGEELNEVRQA